MKRLTMLLLISLALLGGAWLALPGPAGAAGPPCPFPYTVRPGDTLSGIAARVGISVWELAWCNRLGNIHYIYTGQVLCLPRPMPEPAPPPAPAPGGPEAFSSLDLVVDYTFIITPGSEAGRWALGGPETLSQAGQAGLRLSYPLRSGYLIDTYPAPETLRAASVLTGSPIFWLARNPANPGQYTLVAIGDPRPILDLQVGLTRTITEVLPAYPGLNSRAPVSALRNAVQSDASLRAELVGVDGSFVPLQIEAIDYQPDLNLAEQLYELPGLALHPDDDPAGAGYRLLLVLNEQGVGPPGYGWVARCGSWTGGGWWSGMMASWYGCGGYSYVGYRYPRYNYYRRWF